MGGVEMFTMRFLQTDLGGIGGIQKRGSKTTKVEFIVVLYLRR